MAKKEAQYVMIKGGDKVFFDRILEETDLQIIVEKTSLSGRVSRTRIPAHSVVGITTWDATP